MSTLYLKPLPEDDGVISVELNRVPRWKESELSGDEWRYTMSTTIKVKDWKNGGSKSIITHGRDFEEMAFNTASYLRSIVNHGNQIEIPYMVGHPNRILVCFQPSCDATPVNVYRIKQEWTDHPYQGYKMNRGEHSEPQVRAFCGQHSHRGDCDLEDQDSNYELLAFFPDLENME